MSSDEEREATISAGAILAHIVEGRPGEAIRLIELMDLEDLRRTAFGQGEIVVGFLVAMFAAIEGAPPIDEVKAHAADVIRQLVTDFIGDGDAS
jgi:hypothetical protein